MSPLRSRGPLQKGTETKVAHKRAEVLCHPCLLGGTPNKETKSKVAHKWAEVLRNPYALGGPRKGVQKWPAPGSWKKSHSGGP